MTDISATSFFHQAAAPQGIHRGIDVRLSPEDHAVVHDESRPLHERAQHLIDTVTRESYEPLGQHWSTDRSTAEEFSHRNGPVRDPQRTKVVFHAHHPDHDEIEHDPGWREEHQVNDLEDEIPLKKGADVNVHSISWQRGDQHGKPWNRHTFNEEQWHTAVRRTASHPRAEVPPEQAEALEHPSFSEYRRRSLELAKNPTPGTVVWRGETRSGEPHDALRESGVGMHWTVNPDSALVPRPKHESERRVLWQGRVEDAKAQTIPRSHPSWSGRTGHSMDHEAEVRFQPGSKVHIEGAYVWHGQGDPEGHPVPRKPERTHPDWKWHPVGEHAEVRNLGHIDYGHHETPASDAKMPPPWHGVDPHTVVQHEHDAGNHHSIHPGGTYDDIDWDAPGEHVDGHSNAVMTDMALKDGYIAPHSLSHEDASEWLRWHPDRAGIELRHGGKTAMRRTAAVEDGDDVPSRLLNPHGHHIRARIGNHRNVEMVPREEIARYASQETDPERAKAVGHHIATSGEMEPLLLHYHPASGEAYLGEGNHRLRASYPLQMDHLPVRVQRNNYGLPGPGVKVPQNHPGVASGEHIPHDIKPSDIGLTTVDKPTMSEWDKKTELAEWRLLHGSKTAAADGLEHLRQAGYNTDGWSKWQQGHCGTYACALIAKHPHLRFGTMGEKYEDGWMPTHHFAHDDHYAYDSAGKHPLPYHGIDGHANYNELDSHPDDWGMPRAEAGPEGSEHHLAEAIEHAERHQIVQGRYGPHARRTASADTPVPDNDQPYKHEHGWLPRDHFFAPGKKGLDPRLFDTSERMHPEVRQYLLSLLNSFWAPKYGDSWQSWARVYLAGGAASHFWGDNNDLDVLIGVDYDLLNHHCDAFTGEPPAVISDCLTAELKEGLNDDQRMLPQPGGGESGPWESTFFVIKPGPGTDQVDIRRIHPYAAYDLTRDEWAVRPVETGDDFGPEKLPESSWDIVDAVRALVKAVGELPEGLREREGAALYDYLHTDRSAAFGDQGTGLWDPANTTWKALVAAPGEPLQQLIDWKHAHGTAATDREIAA